MRFNYVIEFIGFLFFESCIEPFNVSTSDAGEILVVDGLITDDPGPYVVNLSLSNPLSQDEFSSVSNATVPIEEEDGIIDGLTEEESGRYITSIDGIRGKAGSRYRLNVELPNGAGYQSEWSLLKPSPKIDSVYWRFIEIDTEDQGIIDGAQLFAATHDPKGSTEFYRYEWDETWLFSVPAAVTLEYLGNLEVKPIEEKRFCRTNRQSNVINIASSSNNSSDIISEHPLRFVSTETNELRIRYSIEVTQFALRASLKAQ